MSEIIHRSSRGTVEVFEENGKKRIRRTVNAELPLYYMLKGFKCGYLPQIYSVDITNGKTVVIEEFISGKNLSAANPDEKQIIHIMAQLCDALDFIHGLGIVHRDIKPSNILLANDGNIRIIDFEAARFVCGDKDKDTRYLGTDGFAPPEQYGFSQTDFRADIYAAGQTMKALLGSLSAKRKYAKIIMKCTALDPAERYQSAKALADALTNKRMTLSVFAVFAAAVSAAMIFAAAVPKEAPAENIPDTAKIAAAPETTAVTETEFTSEAMTVSETEAAAAETSDETESYSETTVQTETESASETTITTVTEITTKSTTSAKTETAAANTTVPQTEITSKTETSAETKSFAVITAIPDDLPIFLTPKGYSASSEMQPYYTKVNIKPPAYVWFGNNKNGFKIDSGNYVLKNTTIRIAMYPNDYIDNDIIINGEIANAVSSGGTSNFGINYTIGLDESVLDITSQPTASRKSTVRIDDNSITVSYYVNGWTSGGNISNGDIVRFNTPLMIGCYKNLIAGYDITVNGKVLPIQINGDNTYMLGVYNPDSKETVIGKTKRNKLTEHEKKDFIPVYFGSDVRVSEFPFSDGIRSDEWKIAYSSGDIIEKGSEIRIAVYPYDYLGKTLKINGSEFLMTINGDRSSYLLDYIIPNDVDSLNITLETDAN